MEAGAAGADLLWFKTRHKSPEQALKANCAVSSDICPPKSYPAIVKTKQNHSNLQKHSNIQNRSDRPVPILQILLLFKSLNCCLPQGCSDSWQHSGIVCLVNPSRYFCSDFAATVKTLTGSEYRLGHTPTSFTSMCSSIGAARLTQGI